MNDFAFSIDDGYRTPVAAFYTVALGCFRQNWIVMEHVRFQFFRPPEKD